MKISFPHEIKTSTIFRTIRRPTVTVKIWSAKFESFISYSFLVDTGSDYTLLPKYLSKVLGIDLDKDCIPIISIGIGGKEKVYLLKQKLTIMLSSSKRHIPAGFLDRDDIPPLLGRQE